LPFTAKRGDTKADHRQCRSTEALPSSVWPASAATPRLLARTDAKKGGGEVWALSERLGLVAAAVVTMPQAGLALLECCPWRRMLHREYQATSM
jgi:hypothetical protein